MKESRKKRIKKALTEKPYVFIFILVFLVYIGINVWVNQLYVSFDIFTAYTKWFLVLFLFFNFLLVPALAALTINLAILRFKEAGFGKTGAIGSAGIFGGILGGACPGCFVGLFPAVAGLFGITASLSILPLFGLEIQVASALLLTVAIFLLTRDVVCEVPLKK